MKKINKSKKSRSSKKLEADPQGTPPSLSGLSLSEIRDHLEGVINAIGDPVFVKDREHRFFLVNDALCRMVGLPREKLLGKTDHDFFPKEQADVFRAKDEEVFRSGRENVNEEDITDVHRNRLRLSTKKTVYKDCDGNAYIVGIIRDITERVKIEEVLRKISAAVEHSPAAIVITSLSGNIEYVNPKFTEVSGYAFEEVVGKNPRLLKSGDKSPEKYKELWSTIASGKQWHGEFHNRKKNGELFWEWASISPIWDEKGKIAHYVAVKEDITFRKVSEDILRESEERFRTLTQNSPVGIFRMDSNGDCLFVNKKWCEITGMSPAEAMGNGWTKAIYKDDRAEVLRAWGEAVRAKGPIEIEFRFVTPTGKITWVFGKANAINDDQKKISSYIGTIMDISERKIAESQKEEFQKKLLQADKLAAIGQLAGGVAHEINNPLGVILGFAQIACRQVQEHQPLYAPLKSIEREALRCKNLVQDLLTFSRANKSEKELCDFNQVIQTALSLIGAQAKVNDVELAREFSETLPAVEINRNQIQQLVVNLCNNAIDAMPKGGRLTVRTWQEASACVLQIRDTGVGIPQDVLPKIFDPFFTTKDVGKGTGLGLSLVYEIVQRHRAKIEVESGAGKGSAFTVRFPLPAGGMAAHALRKCILIVDDEEDVAETIQRILAPCDAEILLAQDGFMAGKIISEKKPDLVILDLVLPGQDGFSICRTLRSDPNLNHIKIVAVTGIDVDGSREEILNAGADAFVSKPVDFADLIDKVETLLRLKKTGPDRQGG